MNKFRVLLMLNEQTRLRITEKGVLLQTKKNGTDEAEDVWEDVPATSGAVYPVSAHFRMRIDEATGQWTAERFMKVVDSENGNNACAWLPNGLVFVAF